MNRFRVSSLLAFVSVKEELARRGPRMRYLGVCAHLDSKKTRIITIRLLPVTWLPRARTRGPLLQGKGRNYSRRCIFASVLPSAWVIRDLRGL